MEEQEKKSYEMSSAYHWIWETILFFFFSVAATVGTDSINSLVSRGNAQFPCLKQSYYDDK